MTEEKNQKEKRLLEFFGRECPHCFDMIPLVRRIEAETVLRIEKYEVWHNEENARLMLEFDKGLCGGVPFFFNTASGEFICGAASYDELKRWAEEG